MQPRAAYHQPASETPFEWRFAGGPTVARFYMLTGTRLIDLCEYAVLLIISFSSCLDVVIAYAISLLKTKTQTSPRLRGFVIRLMESINMLFAYCKGGNVVRLFHV